MAAGMAVAVAVAAAAAVAAVATVPLASAVALPLAPLPYHYLAVASQPLDPCHLGCHLGYHYLAVASQPLPVSRLHRHTKSSVSDLSATHICPKPNRTADLVSSTSNTSHSLGTGTTW